MLHPVVIVQVRITARGTAVNHVMISNVNTHMRNAANVITHGAGKKDH